MFHDLDATLAQLLLRELVATYPDIKTDNISFAAPDDEFRRGGYKSPTLNLFLYDVRENWELRSSEWTYERRNGRVTRQGPPIRVDCAYLITAWSAESGPQAVAAEHRLLGNVARALLKHRQLPDGVIQGGQQPGQAPTSCRTKPATISAVATRKTPRRAASAARCSARALRMAPSSCMRSSC